MDANDQILFNGWTVFVKQTENVSLFFLKTSQNNHCLSWHQVVLLGVELSNNKKQIYMTETLQKEARSALCVSASWSLTGVVFDDQNKKRSQERSFH